MFDLKLINVRLKQREFLKCLKKKIAKKSDMYVQE